MIEHVNAWMVFGSAVLGLLTGLISGVATVAWWISKRDQEHVQLINDVKAIKDSCPTKHVELMDALKSAVCAGFKLAIKELGSDFDKKLAERDTAISSHSTDIAVLKERSRQQEADIEAIFGIFNRRDMDDSGRAEGERRHQGQG